MELGFALLGLGSLVTDDSEGDADDLRKRGATAESH